MESCDLELEPEEDDAKTELIGLVPWPEPPRSLSERARRTRSDGSGLSRSVRAPVGSRRKFLRIALLLAAFAAWGFVLGSFYVRHRVNEWRSGAASSPQSAAPPASLPRPHLSIVVGTPPVKKPTIDINNLPPAPPTPNTTQRARPPLNLKRPPVRPTPRPTGPSTESAPPEVRAPTPDRATKLEPQEI